MIIEISRIAKRHHKWVASMGWHNRTSLEALAMVGSEMGEAAIEISLAGVTNKFKHELADIVLRCIDFTESLGIDLESRILPPTTRSVAYVSLERGFLDLIGLLSRAVNAARASNDDLLGDYLVEIIAKSFEIGERLGIDLIASLSEKVEINIARGSRGRVI